MQIYDRALPHAEAIFQNEKKLKRETDDDAEIFGWVREDDRLGAEDHYLPHFPVKKRASHRLNTLHSTHTDACGDVFSVNSPFPSDLTTW